MNNTNILFKISEDISFSMSGNVHSISLTGYEV